MQFRVFRHHRMNGWATQCRAIISYFTFVQYPLGGSGLVSTTTNIWICKPPSPWIVKFRATADCLVEQHISKPDNDDSVEAIDCQSQCNSKPGWKLLTIVNNLLTIHLYKFGIAICHICVSCNGQYVYHAISNTCIMQFIYCAMSSALSIWNCSVALNCMALQQSIAVHCMS